MGSIWFCEFTMFTYQVEFFDAEFSYMNHWPSILAAAVVLVAVDANLTKAVVELKMSLITLWGSPQNASFLNLLLNAFNLVYWKMDIFYVYFVYNWFTFHIALQQEHIFSCYNIMQDLQKRNIKTPQSVVTQNLPSMASSSSNISQIWRMRCKIFVI